MCGITGILNFDGSAPDKNTLQKMTDVLSHRGPDSGGFFMSGPVGLGHRRLSIIDLSKAGTEPMPNEDETIWIVFNGEIYNFRELRVELEAKGHRFRSQTDTEVILHAYEEWGTECLARFLGMFAFALWDERLGNLWLVRDRLGVKPLFFAKLKNTFLFGSEIKAILQHPSITRTVDHQCLDYFLALNYVPAPYTLFAEIKQLNPAEYLIATRDGKVDVYKYWDVPIGAHFARRENELVEEFRSLLEDAVKKRLISDVPLGAFLSGGIDSSSVAYWMAKHSHEPIKAFTVSFREDEFNEIEFARGVAKHLRAEHYTREILPEFTTVLPKLVWHAEEPTANSSMISVYYLSAMARERVTVALGGDGADELMAGYVTYPAHYLHRIYSALPGWLRRIVIQPIVENFPSRDGKVTTDFKLKRFVRSGNMDAIEAHASWRMIFNQEERMSLLFPILGSINTNKSVADLYREMVVGSENLKMLDRLLYIDTKFYLPNDGLVKVDRMSMAHGLEVREPFLDHRLVEFLSLVPSNLKLKWFYQKKYILKKAMEGRLPKINIVRKKSGFNLPNARWLKSELKPFVMDHLSEKQIENMGLFNKKAIEPFLKGHFSGKNDYSHQIWGLLCLSLWWQQFITQKKPA